MCIYIYVYLYIYIYIYMYMYIHAYTCNLRHRSYQVQLSPPFLNYCYLPLAMPPEAAWGSLKGIYRVPLKGSIGFPSIGFQGLGI